MPCPKKYSYKKCDNEKIFLPLENSPPPSLFVMVLSLGEIPTLNKNSKCNWSQVSLPMVKGSVKTNKSDLRPD